MVLRSRSTRFAASLIGIQLSILFVADIIYAFEGWVGWFCFRASDNVHLN